MLKGCSAKGRRDRVPPLSCGRNTTGLSVDLDWVGRNATWLGTCQKAGRNAIWLGTCL